MDLAGAPAERISVPCFFNPALDAQLPVLELPAALARQARRMPDPADPIHSVYGRNAWKSRVRAHPDVAAAHGYAPGRLESENPVLGSRSE